MNNKKFLLLFASAAIVLGPQLVAHACSVCITGANDPTAEAFNASVLFLMATPYAVVGSIGGGLFVAYRRRLARREREENGRASMSLALNQEEVGDE